MKDIPFFQWEGCMATLVLSEIPYRQEAYILVRLCPPAQLRPFLRECTAFCRAAGAGRVYAAADELPAWLPHAYDIVRLTCPREQLRKTDSPALTALDADNQALFLKLQRTLFQTVDGAVTYGLADCERMRAAQSGFLWLEGEVAVGIGEIRDNEICTVGVTRSGAGAALVCALSEKIQAPHLTVQTSSTNARALRLYARLGFRQTQTVSRWALCLTEPQR